MPEEADHFSKEEMWQELEPLLDHPKDEQGRYLKNDEGDRLLSPLEKMARNTIPSGTDYDALNYGPADLAHDTVLRCIEGHKSFKKGTKFHAWVKTVMNNRWKDLKRLKWPQLEIKPTPPEGPEGEIDDPLSIFPDTGLTPEQFHARQKCFEKLSPPSHKEVFRYFFQGYKLRQIVEKIDANINTIATWLTAAKKAYRSCLQDQGVI